ncbi:MAG: hypothetical protein QW334_00295 [Thermofilum sp.]
MRKTYKAARLYVFIKMAREGEGKFGYPKRGKTGLIFVPADVTRDSQFPLKPGQVKIRIDGKRLIVEQ